MKSYLRLLRGMRLWTLVCLGVGMPFICHADSYFEEQYGIEKPSGKKDYERAVLPAEKETLASLLHTLATAYEFKLLMIKSDLYKTGKKIDHIHPLRKLICVFTDEKIRSDFRKMSKRSRVWDSYTEKLSEAIALEADRNNLQNWQIEDFSKTLKVDTEAARSMLSKRRWRAFLDWLVSAAPH